MVDYLGQGFTPEENRISCKHKYRKCDCGAVHCLGPCGFWQESSLGGEVPEKRAPCEFHQTTPKDVIDY